MKIIAFQVPIVPGGPGPTTWGNCVLNGTVPTIGCIPQVFVLIFNALLTLVGITSVIVIMYSGIQMILARGDAKVLETSHKTFFFALAGLLVVLLAFFIVNLVGTITGISCISNFSTFGFGNCSQ